MASIESLFLNTREPFELIIHDDGGCKKAVEYLMELYDEERVSTVILNAGKNMGVGEAVKRCFSIAKGDYLVKADQDLLYRPGWLGTMIKAIELFPDVGMIGGFKYKVEHKTAGWDYTSPKKIRRKDCTVWDVTDFVSSMFLIRRATYDECGEFPIGSGAFAEDCEYKKRLTDAEYRLALTEEDVVENIGFGLGRSSMFLPESTPNDIKIRQVYGTTIFNQRPEGDNG
jgi:glycosyltransferase involved in cell wall biosynthesis